MVINIMNITLIIMFISIALLFKKYYPGEIDPV